MKITMLGCTGSGKTTYLATMLRIFYDGAVKGLFIEENQDNRKVARMLNAIDSLTRGSFPDGTSPSDVEEKGKIYDSLSFSLMRGSDKLLEFQFIDYAGFLLDEISAGKNDKVNSELITNLVTSDVVLIFVDAIKLKECKAEGVAREYLGVNAINYIVLEAQEVAKKEGKKLDIVFAMTKSDSSKIEVDEIDALKERLRVIYSKLYTSLHGDFPIYAVQCVGRGRVTTRAQWKGKVLEIENTITTRNLAYDPKNVVSILAEAFLHCIDNLRVEVGRLEEQIRIQEADMKKFFRSFADRVFNKSAMRNQIERTKQDKQDKEKQIENLLRYSDIMREIIKENL